MGHMFGTSTASCRHNGGQLRPCWTQVWYDGAGLPGKVLTVCEISSPHNFQPSDWSLHPDQTLKCIKEYVRYLLQLNTEKQSSGCMKTRCSPSGHSPAWGVWPGCGGSGGAGNRLHQSCCISDLIQSFHNVH